MSILSQPSFPDVDVLGQAAVQSKLGQQSQYLGRSVNVGFLLGIQEGDTLVRMALADSLSSGEVITGPVKLAQRFLLELLTEQGTLLSQPDRGTLLLTEVRQGYIRTAADARQSFYSAVDFAKPWLINDQQDLPEDERFAAAELVSVTVAPPTLHLRVRLLTIAGDSQNLVFPIPTTPFDVQR